MTHPSKFDDDWAELARELERDKPSSPPPQSEQTPHVDKEEEREPASRSEVFFEERVERIEVASSEEFEDAGESGTTGEGESSDDSTPGDGQPGTGRKRRRRRRRRRKGGAQPADAGGGEEMEQDKANGEESESDDSRSSAVPVTGRGDYDDDADDFSDEPTPLSTAEDLEEDAGGELLRELIANWNVPSWDEVVSGLYRPER